MVEPQSRTHTAMNFGNNNATSTTNNLMHFSHPACLWLEIVVQPFNKGLNASDFSLDCSHILSLCINNLIQYNPDDRKKYNMDIVINVYWRLVNRRMMQSWLKPWCSVQEEASQELRGLSGVGGGPGGTLGGDREDALHLLETQPRPGLCTGQYPTPLHVSPTPNSTPDRAIYRSVPHTTTTRITHSKLNPGQGYVQVSTPHNHYMYHPLQTQLRTGLCTGQYPTQPLHVSPTPNSTPDRAMYRSVPHTTTTRITHSTLNPGQDYVQVRDTTQPLHVSPTPNSTLDRAMYRSVPHTTTTRITHSKLNSGQGYVQVSTPHNYYTYHPLQTQPRTGLCTGQYPTQLHVSPTPNWTPDRAMYRSVPHTTTTRITHSKLNPGQGYVQVSTPHNYYTYHPLQTEPRTGLCTGQYPTQLLHVSPTPNSTQDRAMYRSVPHTTTTRITHSKLNPGQGYVQVSTPHNYTYHPLQTQLRTGLCTGQYPTQPLHVSPTPNSTQDRAMYRSVHHTTTTRITHSKLNPGQGYVQVSTPHNHYTYHPLQTEPRPGLCTGQYPTPLHVSPTPNSTQDRAMYRSVPHTTTRITHSKLNPGQGYVQVSTPHNHYTYHPLQTEPRTGLCTGQYPTPLLHVSPTPNSTQDRAMYRSVPHTTTTCITHSKLNPGQGYVQVSTPHNHYTYHPLQTQPRPGLCTGQYPTPLHVSPTPNWTPARAMYRSVHHTTTTRITHSKLNPGQGYVQVSTPHHYTYHPLQTQPRPGLCTGQYPTQPLHVSPTPNSTPARTMYRSVPHTTTTRITHSKLNPRQGYVQVSTPHNHYTYHPLQTEPRPGLCTGQYPTPLHVSPTPNSTQDRAMYRSVPHTTTTRITHSKLNPGQGYVQVSTPHNHYTYHPLQTEPRPGLCTGQYPTPLHVSPTPNSTQDRAMYRSVPHTTTTRITHSKLNPGQGYVQVSTPHNYYTYHPLQTQLRTGLCTGQYPTQLLHVSPTPNSTQDRAMYRSVPHTTTTRITHSKLNPGQGYVQVSTPHNHYTYHPLQTQPRTGLCTGQYPTQLLHVSPTPNSTQDRAMYRSVPHTTTTRITHSKLNSGQGYVQISTPHNHYTYHPLQTQPRPGLCTGQYPTQLLHVSPTPNSTPARAMYRSVPHTTTTRITHSKLNPGQGYVQVSTPHNHYMYHPLQTQPRTGLWTGQYPTQLLHVSPTPNSTQDRAMYRSVHHTTTTRITHSKLNPGQGYVQVSTPHNYTYHPLQTQLRTGLCTGQYTTQPLHVSPTPNSTPDRAMYRSVHHTTTTRITHSKLNPGQGYVQVSTPHNHYMYHPLQTQLRTGLCTGQYTTQPLQVSPTPNSTPDRAMYRSVPHTTTRITHSKLNPGQGYVQVRDTGWGIPNLSVIYF